MNTGKIKNIVLAIPILKNYFIKWIEKRGSIIKIENIYVEDANKVLLTKVISRN